MSDRETATTQLLDFLESIGFARRYYAYYERVRGRGRAAVVSSEMLEGALAATGLDFKYRAREKFYQYREERGGIEVGLNVAFPSSLVEFILVCKTGAGHIGAPYTQLARDIMVRADPNFTFSPPSPKLPFSNEQELREALAFGVGLFQETKEVLLERGMASMSGAACGGAHERLSR